MTTEQKERLKKLILNEGNVRKGGINKLPDKPKPKLKPAGQNPKPENN